MEAGIISSVGRHEEVGKRGIDREMDYRSQSRSDAT